MLRDEINHFLEQALDRAEASTELSNLIEGYSLCARSEGMSENTVRLTRRSCWISPEFPSTHWAAYERVVNWCR